MEAVYRQRHGFPPGVFDNVCTNWPLLWKESYDLLDAIWQADPDRQSERGLNRLDTVSQANGFGAKEMDAATAPRLWTEGRIAEVVAYCASDVHKTRRLFELVLAKGGLRRGDGQWLALPRPMLPE